MMKCLKLEMKFSTIPKQNEHYIYIVFEWYSWWDANKAIKMISRWSVDRNVSFSMEICLNLIGISIKPVEYIYYVVVAEICNKIDSLLLLLWLLTYVTFKNMQCMYYFYQLESMSHLTLTFGYHYSLMSSFSFFHFHLHVFAQ